VKAVISLRARDLRDLTNEELAKKLAETRKELFTLRFQSATGALESTARLQLTRQEIARIMTVQQERVTTAPGKSEG
jgi:large subunit ribosomal protein L29